MKTSNISKEEIKTVRQIFELRNSGKKYKEISDLTGIKKERVYNIYNLNIKKYLPIIQKYNLKREIKNKDADKVYSIEDIDMVKRIFELRNKGYKLWQISQDVNRTETTVFNILNGRSFGLIAKKYNLKVDKVGESLSNLKFREDQLLSMKEMIEEGYTLHEVSNSFKGTAEFTIKQIFTGKLKGYNDFFKSMNIEVSHLKDILDSRDFSKEDIKEIFRLYNSGLNKSEIAVIFKKNRSFISWIIRGKGYKDVLEELKITPHKKERYIFSEEEVILIFERYNNGESKKSIACSFDVSISPIDNILNHKTERYLDIINKHHLRKVKRGEKKNLS